jgi:hypothetical protein
VSIAMDGAAREPERLAKFPDGTLELAVVG